MAAVRDTMEYAAQATYGSAAYDLNRLRRYKEPEITYQETLARPKEKTAAKTKARERSVYGVSPVSIVGFALAAVLMVFVLLSYVSLTEISGNISELNSELSELTEQEKRLTIAHESAFNLAEVENYAVNVLGMKKLSESQVTVLEVEREDKAEILKEETQGANSFIKKAADYLTYLAEYFG